MADYSYIQPTSETNTSKGVSSQATPTTKEEAERLNAVRNISFTGGRSSRSKKSSSSSTSSTTSNNQSIGVKTPQQVYIEGAKQPETVAPEKITIKTSSTTTRTKINELSNPTVSPEKIPVPTETTRTDLNNRVIPESLGYYEQRPELTLETANKTEIKGLREQRLEEAKQNLLGQDTKPTTKDVSKIPVLVYEAGKSFTQGVVEAFNPYKLAEGVILTGSGVIQGDIKPKDIPNNISESFINEPFRFTGNIVAPTIAGKVIRIGAKASVVVGKQKVNPKRLFQNDQIVALEKGIEPKFPLAKSSSEIVNKFESTKIGDTIYGQTSSPKKISGNKAELVGRGLEGTEGAGISITPLGEGSSYFLGVSGAKQYSFSLNPIKSFSNILDVPTVTIFRGKRITTTPKSVTSVAGFEAENVFFSETVAGSGSFVVPKRILLGQGEIKPQLFKTPKGKLVLEKGTVELEAKIPLGQEFVKVSKDRFTKIGNEIIRVREVELVVKNSDGLLTTSSGKAVNSKDIISSNQLLKEQSYLSKSSQTSKISSGVPIITTSSLNYPVDSKLVVNSLSSDIGSVSSSNINYRPIIVSVPSNIATTSSVINVINSSSISSGKINKSSTVSSGKDFSKVSSEKIPLSSSISISSSKKSLSPDKSYSYTPSYKTNSYNFNQTQNFQTNFNKERKEKDVFVVEVRQGGKFKPIFQTSSKDIAFRTGASEVRGSARASFRIKKDNVIVDDFALFKDIKKSKKEKGVFVEQAKYRINTPGELGDITLKGIRSSKNKRIKLF